LSDAESELEDVVDEEDEVLSGHEENGLESADSVRGLLDLVTYSFPCSLAQNANIVASAGRTGAKAAAEGQGHGAVQRLHQADAQAHQPQLPAHLRRREPPHAQRARAAAHQSPPRRVGPVRQPDQPTRAGQAAAASGHSQRPQLLRPPRRDDPDPRRARYAQLS
jgi:hypothetical protein